MTNTSKTYFLILKLLSKPPHLFCFSTTKFFIFNLFKIINEKTSPLKQLSSLNLGMLKHSAIGAGTLEYEFLDKEYNELINGANLVDGFNGLLTIHLLIINLVLFFINLNNGHQDLLLFITAQIVVLTCFLLFNFPKAKIFLGDSGSYLFGSLVAFNVINTHNLNTGISSFFFCILLFYLFFEVFFSFFRKIFVVRQSPLLPDRRHLHMILYKFLLKKNKSKQISNSMVSVYINFVYLLLAIPAIILMYNGLF